MPLAAKASSTNSAAIPEKKVSPFLFPAIFGVAFEPEFVDPFKFGELNFPFLRALGSVGGAIV